MRHRVRSLPFSQRSVVLVHKIVGIYAVNGSDIPLRLSGKELVVNAFFLHELGMVSRFNNCAVLKNHDLVGNSGAGQIGFASTLMNTIILNPYLKEFDDKVIENAIAHEYNVIQEGLSMFGKKGEKPVEYDIKALGGFRL